jgi:hypothetical protein
MAMQAIESALNMCCGNYEALVGQFKEAGALPSHLFMHLQSTATMAMNAHTISKGVLKLT